MSKDEGRQIIRRSDWTNSVKAGAVLEMGMILLKAGNDFKNNPTPRCPQCRDAGPETPPTGWILW